MKEHERILASIFPPDAEPVPCPRCGRNAAARAWNRIVGIYRAVMEQAP